MYCLSKQENVQNSETILNIFDPSESVLDLLSNQKKWEIEYLIYEGLLWIFLILITFRIHNPSNNPLSETLGQIWPGSLSFLNLSLQLCSECKACIKLSGKHTSRILANILSIFNIFNHFWGLDGVFFPVRTCHNPSNIHFFSFLTPLNHR